MKVLLLGEYSGLHNILKKGLLELGVDAEVATSGDGWKGFQSDIYLGSKRQDMLGKVSRTIFPVINAKKLDGFDIVQMINPIVFNKYLTGFTDHLVSGFTNLILLCAGCDAYYYKYNKLLDYNPCSSCKKYDLRCDKCIYEKKRIVDLNMKIAAKAKKIIPINWEYEFCYSQDGMLDYKRTPTIPMPMDTDSIKFTEICKNDRIVVYHPLIREGFKGTHLVNEAFEKLRKKYSRGVDFVTAGKMPIGDYLKFLETVDIVVEQTNYYSFGMNALFCMAMGKVVLSGPEDAVRNSGYEFYKNCPAINIKPDIEDIVTKLEELINDRLKAKETGMRSREYIEEYHDYRKIALRYLEVYRSIMESEPGKKE